MNEPVAGPCVFVKAPLADDTHTKGYTYFYSASSADTIMERLQTACSQLCGHTKTKSTYHLRVVLPLEVNKVRLKEGSLPMSGQRTSTPD